MKYIITLLFFLIMTIQIQARVPPLINYQGKLIQSGSLANGNKAMQFRIYSGTGTLIWESGDKSVHVTNGMFTTYIGESTSAGSPVSPFSNINWDNYDETYLEIEIEGDTLLPRTKFTAVPYSLLAKKVSTNSITPNMIKPGWGIVPAGAIMMWPKAVPPAGWLECNGNSLNRDDYPQLFQEIQYIYGGSGTTFNLPDYRGFFVRGWDHGAGRDPDVTVRSNRGDGTTGNNVGTRQEDQTGPHMHKLKCKMGTDQLLVAGNGTGPNANGNRVDLSAPVTYSAIETTSNNGSESRPKNINVMYIIKY